MNKLILTLMAFASIAMPVMGGDPSLDSAATNSDQDALILRILKAVETHDYRTLLTYTVDKETDYFGHKNSSSAFIQQDMMQDARSYKWCRFVPDLSTFQTSPGHDSIEYDSDALYVRGKERKARVDESVGLNKNVEQIEHPITTAIFSFIRPRLCDSSFRR